VARAVQERKIGDCGGSGQEQKPQPRTRDSDIERYGEKEPKMPNKTWDALTCAVGSPARRTQRCPICNCRTGCSRRRRSGPCGHGMIHRPARLDASSLSAQRTPQRSTWNCASWSPACPSQEMPRLLGAVEEWLWGLDRPGWGGLLWRASYFRSLPSVWRSVCNSQRISPIW
jgi:hypothetical protein